MLSDSNMLNFSSDKIKMNVDHYYLSILSPSSIYTTCSRIHKVS